MDAHQFLVGGRGYGKNFAGRKWLNSLIEERERERDTWATGVGLVRWACEKPSEYQPPCAPGTNGWYHDIARRVRLGEMTMTEAMVKVTNARERSNSWVI